MKKSCLNDWLKALRSQNYTKCIGALHVNDGFCPLGILCDISQLDTWKKDPYSNKLTYFNEPKYLPQKVREWAGIGHEEYGNMSSLIMVMNDSEKLSLVEIADIIESKYKPKSRKNLL